LAGYFETEVGSIEQFVIESSFGTTSGLFEAEHNLLRLERAARVGLRLPTPWRVVLRGVVNAGKSSLVNALAGYARSLVSPLAGTTRDLVETRLVLDGWEIELVDTAGETKSREVLPAAVELAGIERGRAAAGSADLVLELIPAPDLLNGAVHRREDTGQRLVVATKADLLQPDETARVLAGGHVVATSAITGDGVERLAEAIVQRLVPEAAEGDLDQGVPITSSQLQRVQQLQQRLKLLHAHVRGRITPGLTDPESGA
jgi:tRNA modification GTPase